MKKFRCAYCKSKFYLWGIDYIEFKDMIKDLRFVCEKCEEPYRKSINYTWREHGKI